MLHCYTKTLLAASCHFFLAIFEESTQINMKRENQPSTMKKKLQGNTRKRLSQVIVFLFSSNLSNHVFLLGMDYITYILTEIKQYCSHRSYKSKGNLSMQIMHYIISGSLKSSWNSNTETTDCMLGKHSGFFSPIMFFVSPFPQFSKPRESIHPLPTFLPCTCDHPTSFSQRQSPVS